jgi:hypothetical protein
LQDFHKDEHYMFTTDVFSRYVKRGQVVAVNDVVERSFFPLYNNLSSMPLQLFATDNNSSKFTTDDDMQQLATLSVELPAGYDCHAYSVNVRLMFGRTELTMMATDAQSGKALKTTTRFAHSRIPLW